MKGKPAGFFFGIMILGLLFVLCALPGDARAEQNYSVSGKDYVFADDSRYDYSGASPQNLFFYGAKSLGKLNISGAVEKSTTYNGYPAYGATGSLSIRYAYDGAYQKTSEDAWHISWDGNRWIRDYDPGLLKTVGTGCIMVEKSPDAKTWEKAIDPKYDYFKKEKTTLESLLYTIPESEYKNGMYYRVVVAYRFSKRIKDGFLDEYDNRKCAEVYEFYVASEKNYVTLQDMGTSYTLRDQASTEAGFMIWKNGSLAVVTVNGNKNICQDYDYFAEPGEYNVGITTILGKKYSYKVTVTNGSTFTSLEPETYSSEKNKGFPFEKKLDRAAFGSNLTSLSIVTPKGVDVKRKYSSYGITGKSVSLYLKLNKEANSLGAGWALSNDTWGEKDNQLVHGVKTGRIGTGALIIQTSIDGKTWKNVDKGRYANGLYTTDYAAHYGKAENVLIYTPPGQDVIKGIRIRVLFAYQAYHASNKEYPAPQGRDALSLRGNPPGKHFR